MVGREIRFGSRESELAVIQTKLVMETIARSHPELSLRLITMKTKGDLHPELPLEDAAGQGFTSKSLFTGALEQALAIGEVDLCVHCLKDMALDDDESLPIAGMAKRGDPRDMLLLPLRGGGDPLHKIPGGLPVGCSSMRRRIQLLARVPEAQVAPIRGNVPTRLAKMDQGQYGALILAAAGIERLGIRDRPGHFFAVRDMVPAAGQGVLALQGRRGEDYSFLDVLRDPLTEAAANAERHVIRTMGGGCNFPAAAYAEISGAEITLIAMYSADGSGRSPIFIEEISGDRDRALELAETLARRLLSREESGEQRCNR
jgi:hydroxymethylbilane synthase